MIHLRDYTDTDKQFLLSLTNKLEEYAKSLDPMGRVKNNPGFAQASLEQTLENVAKYRGKIWFAEDKENVIGYIIGVIWEQSQINKLEIGEHVLGEVIDLYIEADYRKKGIGKMMLQKMEAYFKQNGCDSMWIGVFAPNENAHEMYKHYGFVDREIGMLKQL